MSTESLSTVDFDITHRPDFALLTVRLPQGETIHAERSAMVSMDATINLKAGLKGGIKRSLGRAFGGESFIINTFTAKTGPGEVTFAPGQAGDTVHRHLEGNTLYLQRGAYMANTSGVEVTGSWQGAKGFFSGEGLILLKAFGTGDVFFNSYGAILEIDLADESFYVDTGYVVAFDDTLSYNVSVLPGLRAGRKLKSFFFGGEGLVCQFSGTGKVLVQTRSINPFLSWLYPFRPQKKRSSGGGD